MGWLDSPLLFSPAIGWSLSFTLDFGAWLGLALFVVLTVLLVAISSIHRSNRQASELRSDLKLESELQREIARSKDSQWASTWKAPMLPASVIASIWTGRFVSSTPPVGSKRTYESSLRRFTWNYRREAPYILAAALLSLRDAGLIRMFLEPRGPVLDSFDRVRVERTGLAVSGAAMPVIEGGLLRACEAFADKRFGRTTTPAAISVVSEWIHRSQNDPFKWVFEVAVEESRLLGLCEPGVKSQGSFGKPTGRKPIYSIERLAACDDQVVACVSRWREFAINEPDLHQRLMTEVSFGIRKRTRSSG